MAKNTIHSFILILVLVTSLSLRAQEFSEDIVLFTSEQAIELCRNTRGSIGIDSLGRIHVVYGIPDESSQPPENRILYQCVEDCDVSSPIRVDSGNVGGGRHPSLALDSNDTVHVVWHDFRHTTRAGNYIDNVEIYYDYKTTNGLFSDADVRLTKTNAGHLGDNGYVPKICVGLQNRLHVAWYDFTSNGNNADVYLISTDAQGNFPIREGIDDFQITSVEKNPDTYISNWMPDLAVLPDGWLYTVWGFLEGWQGAFELKGLLISPEGTLSTPETVADKGGRFLDPARLTPDSEGNLALVSSVCVDGSYRINFHYKPLDQEWVGPFVINNGANDATQPCAAFLSPTELLIVWQENLGDFYQIVLGEVNPQTMQIVDRNILSNLEFDSRIPTITSCPDSGKTAVAWIEYGFNGDYSVVLRTTTGTSVKNWILH